MNEDSPNKTGVSESQDVAQNYWAPPPKYLFKYRTVHSQEIERTFTESAAYFPSPKDFNDPFDFRPNIGPVTVGDAKKIAGRTADNKGLPPHERRKIQRWSKKQDVREIVKRALDKNISEYGVYSLSEQPDNLLMWSYYSDGHKGFCLIFDASDYPFKLSLPVRYESEYPRIDAVDVGYDVDSYFKMLLTKSSVWKREEEWRLVTFPEHRPLPYLSGNGKGWHRFPSTALVGVILGAQMRQEDRDLVEGWCKRAPTEIKIYRAYLDDEQYRINIEPRLVR